MEALLMREISVSRLSLPLLLLRIIESKFVFQFKFLKRLRNVVLVRYP